MRLRNPCLVVGVWLGLLGALRANDAPANTLSAEEAAAGWILLFDGESLFGWEPGAPANWTVAEGVLSVDSGEKGLLCTTSEFGDYELRVDFRAPPETNSGVFLHTPLVPTDPQRDCYELNIAGPQISPFPTGSFVGRQKAVGEHTSSDWQTFAVTLVGGECRVELNGETVLDYLDPRPLGRGRIGLQHNAGRVEFRNVKLRPLNLGALFNGRDLTGWHDVPEQQSVFTVTPQGWLHVTNGRGGLESDAQFGDFVLQWETFCHGQGLNSGVFFRSIPGEFCNGYECQIHNGFKDGDRTQPADFGTGGFYRRQPARRIVANDGEWFTTTLVATGPHLAAWVNGYPVSDWTDTREPHANPRQGLRLAAGTLILQGHDPTTDISFRNLQATELMPRDVAE